MIFLNRNVDLYKGQEIFKEPNKFLKIAMMTRDTEFQFEHLFIFIDKKYLV